ncbi:MAG: hypothetical protein JSV80_08290, partial [Acidobacteriota bacterium]
MRDSNSRLSPVRQHRSLANINEGVLMLKHLLRATFFLSVWLPVALPAQNVDEKQHVALTPVDQIPKLPMFDEAVDYQATLGAGVLALDGFKFGGETVRVGDAERVIVRSLGRDFVVS